MTSNGLRIWRSAYSDFGRDEALRAARNYTPRVLREIASAGFNAVWIHGLLHEIVSTPIFPELGRRSAAHLRSLRTVIARAQGLGMKIFLYMQPPLGLRENDSFWTKHPEARGALDTEVDGRVNAMCTSSPEVKRYLRGAAEALARELPGLGGVILITASEYPAHCYSRFNACSAMGKQPTAKARVACPRCAARHPSDVAAEIITIFADAFRTVGGGARVIAWNWSWTLYEPDPGKRIIRQLPRDVTLLIDFERGGTRTVLGKPRLIDEYSLGYPGPSPRFLGAMRLARSRGLSVMAKLQIGTTHEFATVPNLPLIGSLYDKARALRKLRIAGFMGCWNFGNMLTANTAALIHFLDARELPPREAALRGFAALYFPGCDAAEVAAAWEQFQTAMSFYPFSIPFLYSGPVNYALAQRIEFGPLRDGDVGRSWMPDRRGDDLRHALSPYSIEEVTDGLRALADTWREGAERLAGGLSACRRATAQAELATARVIGHGFHSAWNLFRAYPLRRRWQPENRDPLRAIMADEMAHLREVLPVVASDRRMGFHSESQAYMFTAASIRRKVSRLKTLLAEAG